jgi:LmbE family N-acetylglucosaminyl deacetylase
MLPLGLRHIQSVLCLGAHADDIELGCGGTLLRMREENPNLSVQWVVFSGEGPRRREAFDSAHRFLGTAGKDDAVAESGNGPDASAERDDEAAIQFGAGRSIQVESFRDRYFPMQWLELKERFDELARNFSPQVIFTHRRDDAHQDHRVLAELTWCAFRDHWILEYEIPKYEGDLGQPNVFVPLSTDQTRNKARWTVESFASQHDKRWFTEETILALARIRGIEAASESGYAEGFYCRKLVL